MATTVTYKGSTIATVNNNTKTLKTAGTVMEDDVTLVDVSSGGTYQAKTNVNPTTSSQTITPDSGYDALSSVQINAMPSGTEGTPSATKGTVSNNSVSVTPSVTNVAGYISGGTKTGTAVTVSASELVSGTKTITENGTGIDVTNYASVDVSVSGGSVMTWETLKEGTYTIYSSSPNYMLITNYTTPFLENETYRITWGSDTYIFQTASDGGYSYDGYYVGNAGVVGGEDDGSGATFFIYRDRSDRAVAAVTDPAGSKFLRIEKQVSSSSGGNYQTKTGITPTTSSQTITADSGYDALESVQINAIPSQYIIPSGNINLTTNGSNIDIAQYATASVTVSGTVKNVQTAQSTTRRNDTALGSINSLTCLTAGTYEVYWTCARSNTSQTWGSQLYINGSAYDTENTTWTNNVQNNHLTGITLAKDDTVAVYGRSRSGYYIYAPQLTIIQTA